MTQALAMKAVLVDSGHEVVAACVGTSDRRTLPSFFEQKIGVPVHRYRSPNFVTDEQNRGILVGKSIWKNLLEADTYVRSLSLVDSVVEQFKPDAAINFYEPLWGLYHLRYPSKIRSVTLAHQLLAGHQDFSFPSGRQTERTLMQALNRVASNGSQKRLALSFTPMAEPEDGGLVVVPPLLRPEVLTLQPVPGESLLVYVMQAGYGEDIVRWHDKNPDVEMHVFWDRQGAPEVDVYSSHLTFHQLSDTKFLASMAACRGLVTTAGFESVCEAMFLGKPALMVPVAGHYEQACNALDAERAGAGIRADRFDFDRFLDYIRRHSTDPDPFRRWVASARERIVGELERALI
jgi:uncharacterized protein (TIGR00661 family)